MKQRTNATVKWLSTVLAILMMLTILPMTTFATTSPSLGNSITEEMVVETDVNSFTFNMAVLFTTDAYASDNENAETYYYKTSEDASWTTITGTSYTYNFTEGSYGDQDIWFQCTQNGTSVSMKITLRYYQGGATPIADEDDYYYIYSYQQLKAITSESSSVKVKLMADIDIYNTTLTSNSTKVDTAYPMTELISFLNGITELVGNNHTITYTEEENSSLAMIKLSSAATVSNLTIDCANNINGFWASSGEVILDNVTVVNEIDDGYKLRFSTYATIEGTTTIPSTLDVYTGLFYDSNSNIVTISCLYSDLTFDCAEDEYGIVIGDGGWFDVTGNIVSADDGQSFLVQDGGLLDLYDDARVDGVTVQSGGVVHVWGSDYYGYPEITNLTFEPGATFQNDSDIDYTITYNGKDIVVAADATYIAPAIYTVTVDGVEQFITNGDTAVQPDDPTKTGYTFTGWEVDGKAFDFDTAITADITIDSAWELIVVEDDTEVEVGQEVVSEGTADLTVALGDDTLETIFTESELAGDDDLKVVLTVNDATLEDLDETEQTLITETVEALTDEVFAFVLDLSLSKWIGNSETEITDLNGKTITITIDIPEDYLADGRTFSIIRIHDGEVTVLDDLDNDPTTITFETGLFSTYAVSYTDEVADEEAEDADGVDTGDTTTALPIALTIVAMACIVVLFNKRKQFVK